MTPTLYETLKYLSRGWTNEQIASERRQSLEAVRSQVCRLLAYFEVSNRTQLVALAYRQRII